jgi:hypothetical protein
MAIDAYPDSGKVAGGPVRVLIGTQERLGHPNMAGHIRSI